MSVLPEIITLVTTTLVGGILKIWGKAAEQRREERAYIMRSSQMQAEIYRQAREFDGGAGFSWTRRTIALIAVFFIIVWPKVVVVFYPDIPVAVASPLIDRGFWPWDVEYTVNSWDLARGGLLITPLDRQLMAAIVGLFFGSEIAKRA